MVQSSLLSVSVYHAYYNICNCANTFLVHMCSSQEKLTFCKGPVRAKCLQMKFVTK